MIKLMLLDIDGVLTDGRVTLDAAGNEYKAVNFKDMDAVYTLKRRGVQIGLITGESTPITLCFRERFLADFFYNGCTNKVQALEEIMMAYHFSSEEICYVGDGVFDIPMMTLVGCSACPADAIRDVKKNAMIQLMSKGGEGCVWELMELLDEKEMLGS